MDNIRFSRLHLNNTNSLGPSYTSGMAVEATPTNPSSSLGVDEFVLDSSRGTLASLQNPISMSELFGQNGSRSYSFIV